MEDVITNPLPIGRYDRIKAELISRLSLSEEQRVHQLLMHDEKSDQRLTQFFRHLRTLAGPSTPSDLSTHFVDVTPAYTTTNLNLRKNYVGSTEEVPKLSKAFQRLEP